MEDWDEVLPYASLDHNDFVYSGNFVDEVDLEDLAFRVFLAWHHASQEIYMGIEIIDDVRSCRAAGDRVQPSQDGRRADHRHGHPGDACVRS